MDIRNPYATPTATVADLGEPPRLPLALRLLRGLAVAGHILLLLLDLFAQYGTRASPRDAMHYAISASVFLLSTASIVALTSGVGGRVLFWATVLMNVGAAGTLACAIYWAPRADRTQVVLATTSAFLFLFLLSVAVLAWLRARPARSTR